MKILRKPCELCHNPRENVVSASTELMYVAKYFLTYTQSSRAVHSTYEVVRHAIQHSCVITVTSSRIMRQDVWIPRNPQREQHQICVDYESEIWSVVTKMLCRMIAMKCCNPLEHPTMSVGALNAVSMESSPTPPPESHGRCKELSMST